MTRGAWIKQRWEQWRSHRLPQKPRLSYLGAFILTLFSCLVVYTVSGSAQSPVAPVSSSLIEITQGWQYHWGDFSQQQPRVLEGTQNQILSEQWQSFQFPGKIRKPSHKNIQILWLRVPLPAGEWHSPTLYFGAVPYILDVYLGEQHLYNQWSLNAANQATLTDYQLPLVQLEPGFQHQTLLFRVYVGENASIYIGLFDRVVLGNHNTVIKRFFQQQSHTLLGILFFALGLIILGLSLSRPEKKSYFYFGVLTTMIGIYTLSRSFFIPVFINHLEALRFWEYTSFYLIPVSGCLFFQEMFKMRCQPIIRHLWKIHLAYAVAALTLVTTHTFSWSQTVTLAQFLFLASAIIILTKSVQISLAGNVEAKLFTLGFGLLTLSAMNDILIYRLEWVNWYQKLYPWGTLLFILTLGVMLERQFIQARNLLQNYAIELETKNTALQRLDQLKDEFLANTSHELKTPLNGIIGIAESLMDGVTGNLSDATRFNLSLIVSSGRRLHQLVNDLLDFSQLKHHNLQLNIKPVGIREVTHVVLTISQPLVGKKPIELINGINPDIPPVDADENRVQQILYNLVSNAIKFTEQGTIEVSATPVNDRLEIHVVDTGIGISPDKINRIFESFEQADGSITRHYGGTGLGLAITKQLVELHGGIIKVDSTPGVGSRFTFTLPLSQGKVDYQSSIEVSKVQDYTPRTVSPDRILIAQEAAVTPEGTFHILIVDDEPTNLQVIVNHLSLQNYAITQASSALEALELIRLGFKPDLILLDIMMPQMTGYELCKKLREQFLPNELPIVLLTAKNQISDLVEGFAVGANDYLTKPVLKNELLARIKTHLRLAKINAAYGRFVPYEFLQFLERESIVDVQLGDQVQKEMSILFADIRSFTSLSEQLSPKANFDFLNSYLGRVSPVIRNYRGFIDKYIGDAVMALFPQMADDAVQAAIEMQKQVSLYNAHRQTCGYEPIAIGIGLHTGSLMLGTVGESQRMDTTVISDAVNLASRLEGLTKVFGVEILISEETLNGLTNAHHYSYRFLGRVTVKGKLQPIAIFEVFDGNPPPLIKLKRQTRTEFERGVHLYVEKEYTQAQQVFTQLWQWDDRDRVVQFYQQRCQQAERSGVSEVDIIIR
ncbi:MAG: ATP-binding protein [Coleofasciculus sp. A1-SPW-01]|uniref:ATP-binding protein n=1 Tax=Coleofasciculus sp. A1-SPW-01 TaxID=3070819 RepID=UPI0032F6404F